MGDKKNVRCTRIESFHVVVQEGHSLSKVESEAPEVSDITKVAGLECLVSYEP